VTHRDVARALAFACHMPPAKLLARARLALMRRVHQWRPSKIPRPARWDIHEVPDPPLPLFTPRTGLVHRNDDGWSFRFVGRTIVMSARIDWTGPEDQLWRMNLHYMEYLEALAPEEGLALMRQWIKDNPPYRRGYWRDSWNSYALSLRVVVWMQWIARHRETIEPRRLAPVIGSLIDQLIFLEANLETDLGGNHLMKNIKALLWASAFFCRPLAERWRATGLRLLDREIGRQILRDGVHDERSPSYHAQVFADLIEIRHALGGDPLGGRLDATLAAMIQAIADLAHPDGGPALFNDAGLNMAYSPDACCEAWRRIFTKEPPAPSPVFGYREAGYFGLHGKTYSLVADMGRIGPDDLPAHAHGDVGSFELSVGGMRMIVDQGVFEYVAGEKRAASRATANHNSLTIERSDQADFFGAFRCGRRPRVGVHRWITNDDGFLLEGSHDGFRHLPGKPVAIRRFEAETDRIRIVDRIAGDARGEITIALLLHPECVVGIEDNKIAVVRGDAALLIETGAEVMIEDAHWWPDMGVEHATKRLRLTLPPGIPESDILIRPIHRKAAGAP
jgi:uncharacterized heparinase superfamily protein